MNNLVTKSIDVVLHGEMSYCKFLSANDSGETHAHQSGFLVSNSAKNMLFTDQEIHGPDAERIPKKYVKVCWQDNFETDCTFSWYESKGELRLTGFGRGFPFINPKYTGALFVFIKCAEKEYQGFIFNTEDEIQDFLDFFGLTPAETNRPISTDKVSSEKNEQHEIDMFVQELEGQFPTSDGMSSAARKISDRLERGKLKIPHNPDSALVKWTEVEYRLFREIESVQYGETVKSGFRTVDDFVNLANQVLNRRKARAGKSLEHHLAAIFDENYIKYTAQPITEGNKRPDFLFPSLEAYHDMTFSVGKLCTLAAKTTCKDRWRQILNEANRLRDDYKYLCTMQQGISSAQMDEMKSEKVILVVPKAYISSYPNDRRHRIWTVEKFVDYVKEMEDIT